MYLVKVCKDRQILDVLHYHRFENVFADVADKTIFREDMIPESIMLEIDKCDYPKIYCASETEEGIADDFEFRYENGIYVYVGRVLFGDRMRCGRLERKCTECICM